MIIDEKDLRVDKRKETLKRVATFVGASVDESVFKDVIFEEDLEVLKHQSFMGCHRLTFSFEGVSGEMQIGGISLTPEQHYSYTLLSKNLTKDFVANDNPNLCLILVGQNQKENLVYLTNNPAKLKVLIEHFNIYYKATQKRLEDLSRQDITEECILAYFKNNPEVYKEFRGFLEYEVSVVQKYAPHIVQSWEYYQKFLEIGG